MDADVDNYVAKKLVGQFALGPFAYSQPIKIQLNFLINQLSFQSKSRYKPAGQDINQLIYR